MSLRNNLQRSPKLAGGLGVGMILFALVFVGWQVGGSNAIPPGAQAYFSDDAGKTFFADDAAKWVPFDHNGKQAYLAAVVRCAGEAPRVAYLIRYTPEAKAELDALPKSNSPAAQMRAQDIRRHGSEVQRPGETHWYPIDSGSGAKVVSLDCPKGGSAEYVSP